MVKDSIRSIGGQSLRVVVIEEPKIDVAIECSHGRDCDRNTARPRRSSLRRDRMLYELFGESLRFSAC